jgi:hypothetical protein
MLAKLPAGHLNLLGLEQLVLGAAAERDHAQERREDSVVGLSQKYVRENEAQGASGGIMAPPAE